MERVQQAISVQVSNTSNTQQIKEANSWLEQFQGTTEAWQVADQLLALEAAGNVMVEAAQTFSAQTMRNKIQYDFAELPAESHNSLRNSLLGHVVRFAPVRPCSRQPASATLSGGVGVPVWHPSSTPAG